MMGKFFLAIAFLLSTFVGAFAAEWKLIEPDIIFDWPRDHGSHPEYRTEWWYCTGIVRDESQREFGYQFTLFRHGIDPSEPREHESRIRTRHLVMGHFAIADLATESFHKAERIRRKAPGFAYASTEDMDIGIDGWALKRHDGDRITITADDPEAGIAIELELLPGKPLVFHGENGYSQKGIETGNASAYVTWPRLKTVGTLQVHEKTFNVSGTTWFDHEWGTSQLGDGVKGWDWFGLRLDDGRDLMAFYLRREDGTIDPMSSATLVDADGTSRSLRYGEFSISPLQTWTSPTTGATYPSKWKIEIPNESIALTLTSRIANAEMGTGESTGTVYWEGPVRIEGSHSGEGYAELTGYTESIAGRFQ